MFYALIALQAFTVNMTETYELTFFLLCKETEGKKDSDQFFLEYKSLPINTFYIKGTHKEISSRFFSHWLLYGYTSLAQYKPGHFSLIICQCGPFTHEYLILQRDVPISGLAVKISSTSENIIRLFFSLF